MANHDASELGIGNDEQTVFEVEVGGFEDNASKIGLILDPGEHLFRIDKWSYKVSQEKQTPYISWKLDYTGDNPDFREYSIFHNTQLEGRMFRAKFGIVAMFAAAGARWEGKKINQETLNSVIGLEVMAKIINRTYQGEDQNSVASFVLPIENV